VKNIKKYLISFLPVIIFSLIPLNHSAQTAEFKTLFGEVVNDSIDISGIHVINANSGGKTITDQKGSFQIGVRKMDSVYFSSIQIKKQLIVITDQIYSSDSIKVYLEPLVNVLDNVTVRPHNLSGNIKSDLALVDKKDVLNFDDVGVPGYKGNRKEKIVFRNNSSVLLSTLLIPLGMPLNIEAVYKQLSGYYDTLRKSRALDLRNKVAVDIIQFYGLNFFKNEFNLNENNLYEFVIGALENSEMEQNFIYGNHGLVLQDLSNFYKSISEEL